MISITFEVTQNRYTLRDALVLPDNHGLTDTEIEELKQKRFNEWYAFVTAPQPEPQTNENRQVVFDENKMPIEVVNNG